MLTQASLKNIPTDALQALRGLVAAELALRSSLSGAFSGTPIGAPLFGDSRYPNGTVPRPKISDFRIGQRVKFNHSTRGVVTITIERINAKTCSGKTDDGKGWRCSPGLLTAA